MTNQTKTRGPWPGKEPRKNTVANMDAIVKTQTPYQGGRPQQGSKWEALFQGVKPGDCFEMPPAEVARAERALRRYLLDKGYTSRDFIVRRRETCDDGVGRVWLVKLFAELKVVA